MDWVNCNVLSNANSNQFNSTAIKVKNNVVAYLFKPDWNRVCIIVSRIAHVTFCLLALTISLVFYIFLAHMLTKIRASFLSLPYYWSRTRWGVLLHRIQNAVILMKIPSPQFHNNVCINEDDNPWQPIATNNPPFQTLLKIRIN